MKIAKKQVLGLTTLLAIGLANIFFFQNCAPQKSNSEDSFAAASLMVNSSSRADGQCGVANNSCLTGTMQNVADSSTQSLWKCQGSGGGITTLCSANFSNSVVNGMCDSKLNSCLQGMFSDAADVNGTNYWNCAGFNGGANASCSSANIASGVTVNGRCGTTINNCSAGNYADMSDTSTNHIWSCLGSSGGTSATCNIAITGGGSSSAQCGAAINSCATGNFVDIADSATYYLWRCNGADGTYSSCTYSKPTCNLSVQARTHVNETFTFNVGLTNGSLPAQVQIKVYGKKNGVTDVNGTTMQVSTPISMNNTNLGGSMAGAYTRNIVIADANGVSICETNSVSYVLTPACGLSTDKTSLTLAENFTLSLNFALANQLALPTVPTNITWYGTKTDASGTVTNYPLSQGLPLTESTGSFPKTSGPFTSSPDMVGSYMRYYIAKDSAGTALCKSNSINYTINNVAAPVLANGVCSTNSINVCDSGTFADITDSASAHLWTCTGVNGGTSATCSIERAAVVNGACGVATNTCLAGALSDMTDSASTYIWACNGVNGGANATCSRAISMPPPINGECSSTIWQCNSGTPIGNTLNQANYSYDWSCQGSDGGTTSSCSTPAYYCDYQYMYNCPYYYP